MAFWDEFLRRLWGIPVEGKSLSPSDKLILHDVLKRSPQFRQAYFQWVNAGSFQKPLRRLYETYWLRRQNLDTAWSLQLLQMPYANGFAVGLPAREMSARDFIFLFDYLKDRVLGMNYRMADASYKLYDRQSHVEMIEQYYLKPRIDWASAQEPYNQEFGNITLELIQYDDQPQYLKLVAGIYAGRQYQQARQFDELIELLLN